MSEPPLQGLRVLDLTRLLPGGYATLVLADLGADVIKVEEPGKGDYIRWTPPLAGDVSAAHIALNRNKRSLTLNLKAPGARDVFLRLARDADVVVESFRPGVMDRLGVGWSALRDANERLVYCAITGYGQDGPRALEAGHDANYISYAGVLSVIGTEDRPLLPGVQVGDLGGGGMNAVMSILAALLRRERTGAGGFCDVSMTDGAASWLGMHLAQSLALGEEPRREAMPLSGAYPCYRVYPAADGWLTVGALEPRFWAALCAALGREDLLDDGFAVGERRAEVIADLEVVFRARTRAEWMEHLRGLDVCVAPVKSFQEATRDEHLRARGTFFEAGSGGLTHVATPARVDEHGNGEMRLPPPGLGEHTDEVLLAAGFPADEVAALRASGVV